MSEKIKNTRNTDNPYELVSGVRLSLSDNKSMNVAIHGSVFDCIRVKKRPDFIMKKFDVIPPRSPKKKSEVAAYKLFSRIAKFSRKCKNPIEVINLFIDAYNENKDKISINISTTPIYSDNADKHFVMNTLVN